MTKAIPTRSQIAARSLEDRSFRARLIADAQTTFEHEMGLIFPDGVEIDVIEDSSTRYTIVLPPANPMHT